ncbi:putative motility protein [Oceanobacillus piezotolerans]|uniref:Putative motility protein n=1 Tax=Oceanobacillus piezotolerans TaxID=2448030 RepID=A0A498D6Z8_9BACI|nr:YjfB family protein [Oceanobacillus piezotolerans]RLL42934.1 putative motility protein [Oceanobacillus piezotolerans]
MDIAALSIGMSQSQVKSDVGLALMNKIMNVSENQSLRLTEMLGETSRMPAHPSLGNKVDIKA